MGLDQPYYPIDPWTLEGVLFNCSAMGLKEPKSRQNTNQAKFKAKKTYFTFKAKFQAKSNISLQNQFSMVSKHKKGLTEVSPINKQRIN